MSETLKQKVSNLMTASCSYCGGTGEDHYADPEMPCGHCDGDGFHSTPGTATDVIRTVLEEMLRVTGRMSMAAFDEHVRIVEEEARAADYEDAYKAMVKQFASDNGITLQEKPQ